MAHNKLNCCCPNGIPCKFLQICPRVYKPLKAEYSGKKRIELRVPEKSTFESLYGQRLTNLGYKRDTVKFEFMYLDFEESVSEKEKFKAKPDCPQ